MKEVIIATENQGKLREIRYLLGDTFETFYSLKDFQDKGIIDSLEMKKKIPEIEKSVDYQMYGDKQTFQVGDKILKEEGTVCNYSSFDIRER